jgi:hypothetical protein
VPLIEGCNVGIRTQASSNGCAVAQQTSEGQRRELQHVYRGLDRGALAAQLTSPHG